MEQAIPVLRIDDYEKAKSYYLEFLGFEIEFEWRHADGLPVYMGVKRGALVLHLTEHRGDADDGKGYPYAIHSEGERRRL